MTGSLEFCFRRCVLPAVVQATTEQKTVAAPGRCDDQAPVLVVAGDRYEEARRLPGDEAFGENGGTYIVVGGES